MLVNTRDGWYGGLNKASWQPPAYVPGLIWPYSFVVLGIAAVLVSNRLSALATSLYLAIFAVSVAAALTWAYQFFGPHNLEVAAIALTILSALTIVLVIIAARASVPVAIALVVYQLWVITATAVGWAFVRLN
jgi:tryptophan-rich sensory protein